MKKKDKVSTPIECTLELTEAKIIAKEELEQKDPEDAQVLFGKIVKLKFEELDQK